MKVNIALGRAVKSGLVRGRITPQGKTMSPGEPVTNGELAVLFLRYMEMSQSKFDKVNTV